MKVFVAGASGALGRRLVPLLVASGYDVVAMTRSPEKVDSLRSAGADPVVADGLDRPAVMKALMYSEPEVVIHEMTGLTGVTSLRNFDTTSPTTSRPPSQIGSPSWRGRSARSRRGASRSGSAAWRAARSGSR
jgi:hypothetical protein